MMQQKFHSRSRIRTKGETAPNFEKETAVLLLATQGSGKQLFSIAQKPVSQHPA
jgi:hypothetical protein